MIRQVKQMMGVGLRFGLGMLGVMKLVRAVLVPVVLVPVVLVPVVLVPVIMVPVIMVPVKAAADTTVIIDDVMSLRFARGSFNAESFEGELHDFTVLVDGRDLMTGAYLMIKPAPASETADNPDVVFIRELEMRDLRLVGEVLPDKAEVTIERITGRNMDLSELISGYDAGRNREFSLRDLTFADAALFDGPSQLRIDGIKILVADAGFVADSFFLQSAKPVELPGWGHISLETDFALTGGRMLLPTFRVHANRDIDVGQKVHDELHRRHPDGIGLEISAFSRSRLAGATLENAVDVVLSLEGLYDLEYGIDFAYRMDLFERMEAISFEEDEDDPGKILAALTPALEVIELDRVWLEVSDQGLLDFVVWSAEQARDELNMTDTDVRLLGADIVPSLVRGIGPLNKPEAIVPLQNFVLNGGMISIDMLPMKTGNVARLGEAFIAGHMPLNVDVMHRY